MMILVTALSSTGGHFGGWRHPAAWGDTVENFEQLKEVARIAERGKFDALFLADGNGVRDMKDRVLFEASAPSARPATFEPLTLLSAIAAVTTNIGLVATSTTTYDEPYHVARKFASLDHLSGGRGGWNIVTTSNDGDSKNFGLEDHVPKEERYERALEFVDIVTGLWDSWAPDAFVQDRQAGRYLDADRVHVLNHHGKYFDVAGPLNASRSPQGRPVLFHAGQSEAGRELAAQYADCVFAVVQSKEQGIAFRSEMRERARKHGREGQLRVLPGMAAFAAETTTDAKKMYDELAAAIPPALGASYLGKLINMDLSKYSVDDRVPAVEGDVVGINAFRKVLGGTAAEGNLTIRQCYERALPAMGHALSIWGTGEEIADQMEDWYRSGAADGFIFGAPILPMGLTGFVEHVIPVLQRRGLRPADYVGKTARENMCLSQPANRFF